MSGPIQKPSDGILTTKLNPPLIRTDIVDRPHLLARLERDIRRPLTLITAPAGYGKSTLAAQWLEASSLPGVWVSLDEADSNPRTLLSYVVAAVRRLEAKVCARSMNCSMLRSCPLWTSSRSSLPTTWRKSTSRSCWCSMITT